MQALYQLSYSPLFFAMRRSRMMFRPARRGEQEEL
jgi:hypothetical protein